MGVTMETAPSVESAARKLGEARLAMVVRCKTPQDWQREWKPPAHPFMFEPGPCWNACVQYQVEDFAAEVGFFLDVLGFDSNALSHDFCMLMPPGREYFFAIAPASPNLRATPRDAVVLQFMLKDVTGTCGALRGRGIEFERPLAPDDPASPRLLRASFRTPNGVRVDLWGMAANPDKTDGG